MVPECIFCSIVQGSAEASIVYEDAHAMAVVDVRQFHPGHVLVIPRRHTPDIRALDPNDTGSLMVALAIVARAVDAAFRPDGLSVWHSVGQAAGQEIPHLHFHVHPRAFGDDLLRVYPSPPDEPSRGVLEDVASQIRRNIRAA